MLRSCPPRRFSETFLASSRLVFTRCLGAGGHHRWRHHQTRIAASHQLIVEPETDRPGFVNKRHALLREVLPHVTEQQLRTIGQTQRLLQLLVIGKTHCHALFVDIEAGKDIVVAWYKLSLNCHRRSPGMGYSTAAILAPDIQHTCL